MKCQINGIEMIAVIAINIFNLFTCTAARQVAARKIDQSGAHQFNIKEMQEKSDIVYKAMEVRELQPTNLVSFQIDQLAISPFLYIVQEKGGRSSISIDIPQQKIADLFEKAVVELEKDNYEEVKNLYQQAYDLDSLYFKSVSNLGDAWSFLGDYHRAEHYLKKAIQLNDAGYQEYLFLADVYEKTGKKKDALDAITYAFMLNKNNPYLLQSLHNILEKNNLCLNEGRLEFPFKIRKTGVKECEIQYRVPDGPIWNAMANCLACWKMEPELQMRLHGEDMFINKVKMYRECLIYQGHYLQELKDSGKRLSANEETFLEKIRQKFINPIVYWEIIAGEEPYIIYMLPQKERLQVIKYIRKFVYKTRIN